MEYVCLWMFCSCITCVLYIFIPRWHMSAQCPQRLEEGLRSLEMELPDTLELPCRFWESTPGPLEKQTVILISELSLLPL